MTKREFVELETIRVKAAYAASGRFLPRNSELVVGAIELWDEIERQVPRDRDPTLGGILPR